MSPWGRGGGACVAPTVPPRGEVMSARLVASGAERWPRPRGHPKRCPAGAGAAGAAEARACPPRTERARRGACATARGVPDPRSAGHSVPSGTQSHAARRSPPRRRTPKIAFAQVACGAVWRWKEAEGRRLAGARGAGARTPTPAARPPEGPRVGSRVPRLALPGSGGSPAAPLRAPPSPERRPSRGSFTEWVNGPWVQPEFALLGAGPPGARPKPGHGLRRPAG